jgi:hypothetical protein
MSGEWEGSNLHEGMAKVGLRSSSRQFDIRHSLHASSLPPVANLFPGVLAVIDQDLNALKLDPDESIGLGLGMALFGNLVTTLGLNIQRYAHTKAEPGEPVTGSRLWWLGVGLMILGEMGMCLISHTPPTLARNISRFSL